jgi:hypothetical protein
MQPVIASTSLTAVPAGGDQFEVAIELHQPYLDEDGVWRCAATMHPLWKRLAHAAGGDSLQSVCLAIALVRSLLKAFQEDGGTLLMDGKPWPFNAYAMGTFDNA